MATITHKKWVVLTGSVIAWLMLYIGVGNSHCLAQAKRIQGYVRSIYPNQPVESAHITLNHLPDSVIVAFAKADKNGFYNISFPLESQQHYFLNVSHLSYRERKVVLPVTQPVDNSLSIDIQLEPGELILNEVKVSALVPVTMKGDSTRYKVDAFRNGSEQTLEEVLRKMPNIRVETNGDIYFKNQRIEKILLDSDDLLGTNYQLATRSINPAILSEVQAVEHFSENKLLRKIEQSNKVVLNLTVKDKKKSLLFGNVDIGVGPQRYDGVNSLFSYQKKLKAFSILSTNNVGVRRLDPIQDQNVVLPSQLTALEQLIRPFTQTGDPMARPLNLPLENFNGEQISTLNLALQPTNFVKVTTNISFYRDCIQQKRAQTYQTLSANSFSYRQLDTLQQRPQLALFRMQAIYDISSRTTLIANSSFGISSVNLAQQTQFSVYDDVQLANQQFSNQTRDWHQTVEFTHKWNPLSAVVVTASLADNILSEQFQTPLNRSLTTYLYPDASAANPMFNQLVQQNNQRLSGEFRWLYGNQTQKFEQQFGYLYSTYHADLRQLVSNTLHSDALVVNRKAVYTRSSMKYAFERIDVSASAQLSYINTQIDQQSAFLPLIQIGASALYRIDPLNTLSFGYTKKASPVANSYLINSYVLTDFRSAQQGNRAMLVDNQSHLSMTYQFTDLTKRKLTFIASAYTTYFNNLWSFADFTQMPEFTQVRLTNTPGITMSGLNLLGEKLIYPMRGNVRLDIKLARTKLMQVVNGEYRQSSNYIPSITGRYVSVFDSPFNMEIGGTYRLNRLSLTQNDQPLTQSYTTIIPYIRLFFIKKRYQVNIKAEDYLIQKNNLFLLKADATLKVTDKLSMRLEGVNLLNRSTFEQINITPTLYSNSTIPLLNRMVLLHVMVSL